MIGVPVNIDRRVCYNSPGPTEREKGRELNRKKHDHSKNPSSNQGCRGSNESGFVFGVE